MIIPFFIVSSKKIAPILVQKPTHGLTLKEKTLGIKPRVNLYSKEFLPCKAASLISSSIS